MDTMPQHQTKTSTLKITIAADKPKLGISKLLALSNGFNMVIKRLTLNLVMKKEYDR